MLSGLFGFELDVDDSPVVSQGDAGDLERALAKLGDEMRGVCVALATNAEARGVEGGSH